ncbi:hypothetical protein BE221DRAFT_69836 [Ostreococcus tauri]|uniref:Uncharacterized protein n=1 Tax=Ostreococcus tauri TaxID=70448 RepID=A0A1Y5IIL1_OSTTA|nr:hypothetical protein BE221DRAFT_69836 [Ostreococcus tauri]
MLRSRRNCVDRCTLRRRSTPHRLVAAARVVVVSTASTTEHALTSHPATTEEKALEKARREVSHVSRGFEPVLKRSPPVAVAHQSVLSRQRIVRPNDFLKLPLRLRIIPMFIRMMSHRQLSIRLLHRARVVVRPHVEHAHGVRPSLRPFRRVRRLFSPLPLLLHGFSLGVDLDDLLPRARHLARANRGWTSRASFERSIRRRDAAATRCGARRPARGRPSTVCPRVRP